MSSFNFDIIFLGHVAIIQVKNTGTTQGQVPFNKTNRRGTYKVFFLILFLSWVRAYLVKSAGSMLGCIWFLIFKLVWQNDLLLVCWIGLTELDPFGVCPPPFQAVSVDGSRQPGFLSSHEHRSPAFERSRSIRASTEHSSDYSERETRQQEKEWEHQWKPDPCLKNPGKWVGS